MHDYQDQMDSDGESARRGHPERGASTLEWSGLGAASIAAILVLVAAMQAAGLNIISWIQDQLIG